MKLVIYSLLALISSCHQSAFAGESAQDKEVQAAYSMPISSDPAKALKQAKDLQHLLMTEYVLRKQGEVILAPETLLEYKARAEEWKQKYDQALTMRTICNIAVKGGAK